MDSDIKPLEGALRMAMHDSRPAPKSEVTVTSATAPPAKPMVPPARAKPEVPAQPLAKPVAATVPAPVKPKTEGSKMPVAAITVATVIFALLVAVAYLAYTKSN